MNKIQARVENIQTNQSLHIVSFISHGTLLKMMSLELPNNLKKDTEILLSVKATNVALAKNITKDISTMLSYSNQLPVTILSIDEGELLSSLLLEFHTSKLESIITTDSKIRMKLKVGEKVTALIKSSDLAIERVL